MTKNAFFSNDGKYRYWLSRIFDETLPVVAFVGLNPSVADAEVDDPTIKRCISYCKQWGYGGFYMVNLFAFKATSPKEMLQQQDPVGEDNDRHIQEILSKAAQTICCWGELGRHQNRSREVLALISNPYCLGVLKNGEPGHPLYLKGDLQPIPYPVAVMEE